MVDDGRGERGGPRGVPLHSAGLLGEFVGSYADECSEAYCVGLERDAAG